MTPTMYRCACDITFTDLHKCNYYCNGPVHCDLMFCAFDKMTVEIFALACEERYKWLCDDCPQRATPLSVEVCFEHPPIAEVFESVSAADVLTHTYCYKVFFTLGPIKQEGGQE